MHHTPSSRVLDALSSGWVTSRLGVSRTTLKRWRDEGIPPGRRDELRAALLELAGTTKEAAPPEWAERLESRLVEEVRSNREVVVAALSGRIAEAVAEALAELQPQPLDVQAHAGVDQEE